MFTFSPKHEEILKIMQNNNLTSVLKDALNKRNNPVDYKAIHLGKVVKLSPLIVSIYDDNILLEEDNELYISEWFRFRCDIDKEKTLSQTVPSKLDSAKAVTETHSFTSSPCSMPSAISYLADAISGVNSELLALKCDLKLGDYVAVGSLEQTDRYILLDKVL